MTKKQKRLTIYELAMFGHAEVVLADGTVGKIERIDFANETAFIEAHHDVAGTEYIEDKSDEFHVNSLKPILRPMSSMTDEEVLRACEITHGFPFVSNKKWDIDRKRDDVIYVKSKRSEYSFAVYVNNKTGYGDVTVYKEYEKKRFPNDGLSDDNLTTTEIEQTGDIALITKFYIENKLDCMGWIDAGLAVNKDTMAK